MQKVKFDSSTKSQRKRLLTWLQKKPITTIEARHSLDILEVGTRICELRHQHGYNIKTHWSKRRNPGGDYHRVAMYVLHPGKYEGKSND